MDSSQNLLPPTSVIFMDHRNYDYSHKATIHVMFKEKIFTFAIKKTMILVIVIKIKILEKQVLNL